MVVQAEDTLVPRWTKSKQHRRRSDVEDTPCVRRTLYNTQTALTSAVQFSEKRADSIQKLVMSSGILRGGKQRRRATKHVTHLKNVFKTFENLYVHKLRIITRVYSDMSVISLLVILCLYLKKII